MRYAVISRGKIRVRALPTKAGAEQCAEGYRAAGLLDAKAIIDPRSLVR